MDLLHIYLVARTDGEYVCLAATEDAAIAMGPPGGAVGRVTHYGVAVDGHRPGVILSTVGTDDPRAYQG